MGVHKYFASEWNWVNRPDSVCSVHRVSDSLWHRWHSCWTAV